MLKEGKIGVFEAVSIVVFMSATKVLYSSARYVVEISGTAAWYETIISGLTALAGFWFIFLLMKRFEGGDLVFVFETAFGKIIGKFAALIVGFLFFYNSVLFTREFVELAKIFVFPLSPPSFIIIIFTISILPMIYFGFETVARTAALFAWPLLAGIVLLYLLGIPLYNFSNIFPILGHGPGTVIPTGMLRSSVYGDVLALTVVANSLQGTGHLRKSGVLAITVSVLIISAGLLTYNLAFPYSVAAESTNPLYTLSRSIQYGRFFQRFEAIFLFIFSISAILASGINLYMSLSIYCKVFRIDDLRPIILPLVVLLFTTSILPPDISTLSYGYVQQVRMFSWVGYFIIPLLALLTAVVRGRRGGPAGA